MEYLLAAVILLVLVAFVTAPLRGGGEGAEASPGEDPVLAELEARKQAKYREIRDAEMDRAQGKLSEADFARQDAELRRDAVEILKQLDRAQGKGRPAEKEAG